MSEKLQIILEAVDQASGVIGGITNALGGIGSAAAGALKVGLGVAAGAATTALGGLAAGMGLALNEAIEAQEVQAQLNAVLESTGGIAGVTADMANDLASSLSQVTRFGDEAILSGENILLTFTNIGEDVFPQATQTMLDMSQALGQDLKSSAIQLGKALQDPEAGVTALARVGVNFIDAQKDMIKAMVEAGDVAGAQKYILQELQTEFGGSAIAAGETFAGQLDILKNQMLNVAESAGSVLLPVLSDSLRELSPLFIDLAGKIADLISSDQFKQWLSSVATFLVNQAIPALISFTQWFSTSLIPAIGQAGNWISGTLIPALQSIWATMQEIWTIVQPIVQGIVEFFSTTIPQALATLKLAWDTDFMAIRTIFETLWENIKLVFDTFRAAFEGDWFTVGQNLRTMTENIKTALIEIFTSMWNGIKQIDWAQLGKDIIRGIGEGLKSMAAWLITTGKDIMQALYDIFRGFFEAHSPSDKMIRFGANLIESLGMGADRAAAALANSLPHSLAPIPVGMTAGIALSSGALPAGGGGITVVYSPGISLGDRAEFENQLVPLLDRAMRAVNRGSLR